jgi:hypothetical protein
LKLSGVHQLKGSLYALFCISNDYQRIICTWLELE